MERLRTQRHWNGRGHRARGSSALATFPVGALMLPRAGGFGSLGKRSGSRAEVTVQAAAVETKTIQDESTDATLYPRDQAAIVPKVSAPIEKFYVERGSEVHAGQLLAEWRIRIVGP